VAALLTVARFSARRSELGVADHGYDPTALDDLLGVDKKLVNDDRLYRALDQIGQHKDALCSPTAGAEFRGVSGQPRRCVHPGDDHAYNGK